MLLKQARPTTAMLAFSQTWIPRRLAVRSAREASISERGNVTVASLTLPGPRERWLFQGAVETDRRRSPKQRQGCIILGVLFGDNSPLPIVCRRARAKHQGRR